MPSNNFRDLLLPFDCARFSELRSVSARDFGMAVRQDPMVGPLIAKWDRLSNEPFQGITSNGKVEKGLFCLAEEGAPTHEMVAAAEALLSRLSATDRAQLVYTLDAVEWRRWANPEFLINPNGLRLEEMDPAARDAAMGLIRASLSGTGYQKAVGCMRTNAFLGQLCGLENLMNEWSYNILLFGTPSINEPWGWSFYGHHLALNCFVLGGQMVISPTFMGAEPNHIDAGPHEGLRLFSTEEDGGLELMRSLPPAMQVRAQTYAEMHDPAMPEGRWNFADQRHLGGAFRDNQIIPEEGIPVSEFSPRAQDRLLQIVEAFICYLPDAVRSARMSQIEAELGRTTWSWIGSWGDDDPFYYRIQSPLLMVEFDHHSGIWLANEEPAKCHIHTVVRTPNGNDYGKDLLRQHYAQVHPGCTPGHE